MRSAGVTWKSVVATFVLALVFYALAWKWLTGRQTGRGPWQVDFSTNATGTPFLAIHQPALGHSNVVVRFEGEVLAPTNGTGRVEFSRPRMTTPFGRVIYDDLMFQPGSVALDVGGHVVEMLPRGLILNGRLAEWQSGSEHVLRPTNKVPEAVRQQWKGGYR